MKADAANSRQRGEREQAELEEMQAKELILSAVLFAGMAFGAQAAETIKGDPKAGEVIFNKCKQCHHIGEGAKNFYGPTLNGILGRKAGTVPGYNYSPANKNSNKVWDVPTLESYLRQPQHDVPDTYMTFTGLKNQDDIDNVIAFMAQFNADGSKK
jgi:cytochrome c